MKDLATLVLLGLSRESREEVDLPDQPGAFVNASCVVGVKPEVERYGVDGKDRK